MTMILSLFWPLFRGYWVVQDGNLTRRADSGGSRPSRAVRGYYPECRHSSYSLHECISHGARWRPTLSGTYSTVPVVMPTLSPAPSI
jgi:hypothetical protein